VDVHGRSGDEVALTVRGPTGEEKIQATDILVAAGRIPNTAGIGLETIGAELDARGYIRVNDRLETTAPDVWALGECAGSPSLRTRPSTTSASSRTISPEGFATRATDSYRIAYSLIRRSLTWD
jgi:pyruvate/2-oxoglutarate dehydrogenase complex dihydrolipoamide dehydrogenase (E3) component